MSRRQSPALLLQDGILPANFNENLEKVLTHLPYKLSSGASTTDCQSSLDSAGISCSGLSAQTATYSAAQGRTYDVTMCICEGGPYDAHGLATLIAGIPDFLLFFLKGAHFRLPPVSALHHQADDTAMNGEHLPNNVSQECASGRAASQHCS